MAVLEYYAFETEQASSDQALENFRRLARKGFQDFIYSAVGYDPNEGFQAKFKHWHERLALNYQSAPRGYFCIFNESSSIVYELIMAGVNVDPKTIPDISIGQAWAKHWRERELENTYGERRKYPHNYPDSHPQAKSNPQIANCYPISALGYFREWLWGGFIEDGKLRNYLQRKVKDGLLSASQVEAAIERLDPPKLPKN